MATTYTSDDFRKAKAEAERRAREARRDAILREQRLADHREAAELMAARIHDAGPPGSIERTQLVLRLAAEAGKKPGHCTLRVFDVDGSLHLVDLSEDDAPRGGRELGSAGQLLAERAKVRARHRNRSIRRRGVRDELEPVSLGSDVAIIDPDAREWQDLSDAARERHVAEKVRATVATYGLDEREQRKVLRILESGDAERLQKHAVVSEYPAAPLSVKGPRGGGERAGERPAVGPRTRVNRLHRWAPDSPYPEPDRANPGVRAITLSDIRKWAEWSTQMEYTLGDRAHESAVPEPVMRRGDGIEQPAAHFHVPADEPGPAVQVED